MMIQLNCVTLTLNKPNVELSVSFVEIGEITGIRRHSRSVPFISSRNFRRESFAASTSLN